MDTSSAELLERARCGDRAALEELIERHQAQVYRFGLKMCRDPEDAKDVLQDTLVAMARGIRDFRGASSLSTWLFSIARSFCIKKRRRSKFAPEPERSLDSELGAGLADSARDPEAALAGKEVERALEQAIRSLEPGQREVLLLRDVEGLSAREVAEVVGASVAAVKSRLHRARLAVRQRMAPLLGVLPEDPAGQGGACPDVLTTLSRYLEDEISPDLCAEMEQHVTSCARCRGACESLRRSLALCRAVGPAVEVPAAVQQAIREALQKERGSPRGV